RVFPTQVAKAGGIFRASCFVTFSAHVEAYDASDGRTLSFAPGENVMQKWKIASGLMVLVAATGAHAQTERIVSWGTLLNPDSVVADARKLAQSLVNPQSATWRAKGDQKRSYRFDSANATVPYRLVIPPAWDGTSKLPLVVFLHSGGANENTNLDANNKQL